MDWTIDLEFNDMRAPNFKQTYTTDNGILESKELFRLNTFKGRTSDNRIARFTIDNNIFFGVILGDREHYVIRPANDYTKNKTDETFIAYRSTDIISNNENIDYLNNALKSPEDFRSKNMEHGISSDSMGTRAYVQCTYYFRIATDADFQFYQAMGSNVTNAYNHIFTVLNIVEGAYESYFNMRFLVTFQNVFTTNTIYTSTDDSILLRQFRSYWNTNSTMQAVSRNIAHLFTGKTLDNFRMGRGFIGQIENPFISLSTSSSAFSLSMNRLEMYQTTAHEIGHNLNALDNPANCSCGLLTASVMCQGIKDPNLWFCTQSINEINPFLYSNRNLLLSSFVMHQFLTSGIQGFNFYQATLSINSSQVINSGFTAYRSPFIFLQPGFEVKLGAVFLAEIKDITDCGN
jgi:hypothetical protein